MKKTRCSICEEWNAERKDVSVKPANKILCVLLFGRKIKIRVCQSCASRLFRSCNSKF